MAIVIGGILLQFFVLQTASAQMDWLKSGQELLDTVTTSPRNQTSSLTNSEIASGLKDALKVGTETVVGKLGQHDGFNEDPAIHIPLPENMQRVKTALEAVGMSAMMEDLELKLNRAAEAATPPAKKLFWNAIEAMTLDDVKEIYNGPDDSATRYFESKMSEPLATEMQPIVAQALSQVGAIQTYDAVMGQYDSIPFLPDVKSNLNSYVVDKGMEGIFHYLAIEEAAIRQNPAKRTTDILQMVFGAK
ncbi:MAG TPA: DUF4197 domain-containing protein [Desulfobacteraceae bacterium]|nr:DUF4197 domain-containing protein [Desulfobacteraceae bacterium]